MLGSVVNGVSLGVNALLTCSESFDGEDVGGTFAPPDSPTDCWRILPPPLGTQVR